MIYILIYQNPLHIQAYSSLTALLEDNDPKALGASKSKLQKWNFDQFNYITHKVIIAKRTPHTAGDIRRNNTTQSTI